MKNMTNPLDEPSIRYIKLEWPESQYFLDNSNIESLYCYVSDDNIVFVPETIYYEYKNKKK